MVFVALCSESGRILLLHCVLTYARWRRVLMSSSLSCSSDQINFYGGVCIVLCALEFGQEDEKKCGWILEACENNTVLFFKDVPT